MGWNIAIDIATRSNQNIVAYLNIAHDSGIGTDPYRIPNTGRALPLPSILLPNGHSFMEIAIKTNYGSWINCDVECMPEI